MKVTREIGVRSGVGGASRTTNIFTLCANKKKFPFGGHSGVAEEEEIFAV